jgi:3-hydroxyisobutyrate dehydrogenase-like beta-hydroxyacid dehydrogenase
VFARCDRVLLALLDDAQTANVLAAGSPRRGTVIIDVHTGDPDAAERFARELDAAASPTSMPRCRERAPRSSAAMASR